MIVIVIMTAIDKFFANGMMLLLSLFDDVFLYCDNKLLREEKMIEQMRS